MGTAYWNGRENIEVDEFESLLDLNQENVNILASGPQDSFNEKLNIVNQELNYYGVDPINVTNKWNWKPGSYDKIREYVNKKLELNKKAMSVSKIMMRAQDRMNYMTYIQRQMKFMEGERANLKKLGVAKDVDINKFKEDCKVFVNNILTQCKQVYKATNEKIDITPLIKIDGAHQKPILFYDIILQNLKLQIYQDSKLLQSIDLEPIHLIINVSLRHQMHNIRDNTLQMYGKYGNDSLAHVFIQTPYSYRNPRYDNQYGTVCLSSFHDEIIRALRADKLMVFAMTLMNWAQFYNIKHANPYNQPYRTHIGMPEEFSDEYKAIMPYEDVASSCANTLTRRATRKKLKLFDRSDYILNQCNKVNCSIKSECFKHNLFSKMNNRMNSEFGFQNEGLVGLIVEHFEDFHEEVIDGLDTENFKDEVYYVTEKITGEAFPLNDSYDIIETSISAILYYLNQSANEESFDTYLMEMLDKKNLLNHEDCNEEDKCDDDNEKMKTIMKTWAETQGGN